MGTENKVQFGLSSVYYAVLTEGATNSWATPVAIKGAVDLNLADNSSSSEFKADNVTFYQTFANNGYTGDLEFARIPDDMLADVWGISADATDKVVLERANIQPKPFALLFRVEGDQQEELNCLYRCVPTGKPPILAHTKEENAEPQTQTFSINVLPLVTGTATQQGLVRARTNEDTTSATKTGWFTSVFTPTEPTPPSP